MDPETENTIEHIRLSTRDLNFGRLIDLQRESLSADFVPQNVHATRLSLSMPHDTNLVKLVVDAIRSLGEGNEIIAVPIVGSVAAESITHYDKGSDYSAGRTILYFHGGQFWRKGRATSWITSELARQTEGRCIAVRYSLSPQRPFPAALIEGLATYICLLYPPEESPYTPVSASDICFAGDSAGGNIALAIVQLILEINRSRGKLFWNAKERDIPVPAGAAVLSPYVDLTRSLDSEVSNLQYDIIGPRGPPFTNFARCEVWPAKPPRHHVYTDDSALFHPLVSPLTAKDWEGAPPVWICVGEECLADQGILLAEQLAVAGVTVLVEQYCTMPHNFTLVVPKAEPSRTSLQRWASFIRATFIQTSSLRTEAVQWSGVPLLKRSMDLSRLVPLHRDELLERMKVQIRIWGAPPS